MIRRIDKTTNGEKNENLVVLITSSRPLKIKKKLQKIKNPGKNSGEKKIKTTWNNDNNFGKFFIEKGTNDVTVAILFSELFLIRKFDHRTPSHVFI